MARHVLSSNRPKGKLAPYKAEIVRLYQEGKSTVTLAKQFGATDPTIAKILNESGIKRRSHSEAITLSQVGRPRKCSDADYEEMGRLYSQGVNIPKIAKKFDVHSAIVSVALRKVGVASRSIGESRQPKIANPNAFYSPNETGLYWLGILLTDGNIFENRITLGLAVVDTGHIKKFRNFVGVKTPIFFWDNRGYQAARLAFSNAKMVRDLARYGVVPRKTDIAVAMGGVETSKSFWRGCIDGDGHIAWTTVRGHRYPVLHFCSNSRALMEQYRQYVKSVYPSVRAGIVPNKERPWFSTMAVVGAAALEVIRVLYGHGGVSLDRKQKIADEIIEWGRTKRFVYGRPGKRTISDRRQVELF